MIEARQFPWPRRCLRALLACAGLLPAACDAPVPARPNVILVSIDTLDRDALPCFEPSAQPLPAIQAFAARSLCFERAYTTAPWTLPAHASLFTGLYPDRHHAIGMRFAIASQATTLAAELGRGGYETIGIAGGGYVGPVYGFGRGFTRYESLPQDQVGTAADNVRALFAKAEQYLRGRAAGAPPFFLFLHTYAVHNYFRLHPWAVAEVGEQGLLSPDDYFACLRGERTGSAEDWRHLKALYDAEVRAADRAFGAFTEQLHELGRDRDTLLILLSDHGEGFAPELHRIHHCGRQHADLIRVPMIIGGAGVPAGRTAAPVSLIDIMPTLLERAGLRVPDGLDGHSFAGLLRGEAPPPPRTYFSMEYSYAWQNGRMVTPLQTPHQPLSYAFVWNDLWYIRDPNGEELYDIGRDPGQRHDLSGNQKLLDTVRQRAALDNDRSTDPRTQVEMAEKLKAALRALGYVK